MEREFPRMRAIARPDSELKQAARRTFGGEEGTVPSLKESFCSAHTGMYIFDAFGDIYTCWEKTGDPSIRLGHVGDDGRAVFNSAHMQLWRSRTVASNPVCRSCRYALHCGGGCAVLAYKSSGEYHMNYCDGFATSFRSSVAEAYMAHVTGGEADIKRKRVCDQ